MLAYSTPEEEFSHAVYLLNQVKQTLARIAFKDPDMWEVFADRLIEAGVDRLSDIASECDLVSLIVAQNAVGIRGASLQSSETIQ